MTKQLKESKMCLTIQNFHLSRKRISIFHILSFIISFCLISANFYPVVASPQDGFSPPIPSSPASGAVFTATGENGSTAAPPVAIPAFSWSQVGGASNYRVQISQDQSFSTKLEFTTPLTRLTPTNASQFNDGVWYWRVKVDSPNPGSEYSSTQSFSREWASENNQPTLVSPLDGSFIEFLDSTTFQWTPVLGAAKYRFQVSSSSNFTTLIYNQTTLTTFHQPLAKFAEGTYYWRIIPLDPANREGTPSVVQHFTQRYNQIPVPLEPGNGSFPTFTPTFHWTAVQGAQFYRLQYSTDPTFNSGITQVETRNTQYTPNSTLPNDVDYYWRVRTISGQSQSNWSDVWSFQKRWYLQSTLLTPINLYQLARFPMFSWTPVPGATSYKIEVNSINSFPGGELAITANPFYSFQNYSGSLGVHYWRVTPIDANNHNGKPSSVSSYVSYQGNLATPLIYPLYYYTPDPLLEPHEDRSIPQPVFQWNRVLDLTGYIYAPAYRIQVSTSPAFIPPYTWTADTENLVAAPTIANNFTPNPNQVYYWRVCPLSGLGGVCLENASSVPWWSQAWKTRIDTGLLPLATSSSGPELVRPRDLYEYGEITPLLEWLPYQGADSYEVQISRFSDFSVVLNTGTVPYPAYAPGTSFAQRSLGKLDFGTFFWRVRALSGGFPSSGWSATRRFLIASHSQWLSVRSSGDLSNRLQIASDPAADVAANYDLTTLQAAQDKDYWYFGFNANMDAQDMKYVLYLDLDHKENSGATVDALGYSVTAASPYQPEYAIYVSQNSSAFSADAVELHQWLNNSWSFLGLLSGTGGSLYHDAGSNYVELKVANTAIGMQEETGSYALAMFSVPSGSGSPQDSVPTSPAIPGSNVLTQFTNVTERLTTSLPPDHTPNDPLSFSSIPPYFWEHPEVAPWAGVNMKVYLDEQFTTQVADFTLTSNLPYYSDTAHPWPNDLSGDNTYYWRLRPRYLTGGSAYLGAWSEGRSFVRTGLIPINLSESVSFATPTFSWDMIEGSSGYDLQVDNDPNFSSTVLNVSTTQNEYTPTSSLPNDIYYWRVRSKRYGNATNEWSPPEMFALSYPVPTGLSPNDPTELAVVGWAPTLCWTPLIASQGNTPTLAAYKYRLQISFGDPTFSSIYENVDTEQSCYTPSKGYQDGKYYWRVAMIDGSGNLGAYSPAAEFTKQYPMANLVYPLSGDTVPSTPNFRWTSVNGAASYRLEISKYATFSPLYNSVTTHLNEYTPNKFYDINLTYYWRVAIIDGDGRYGPFNNETIVLDPTNSSNKLFLPIIRR